MAMASGTKAQATNATSDGASAHFPTLCDWLVAIPQTFPTRERTQATPLRVKLGPDPN